MVCDNHKLVVNYVSIKTMVQKIPLGNSDLTQTQMNHVLVCVRLGTEEVGHHHVCIKSGRVASYTTLYKI